VMLVDFRGFDTFGEGVVLALVALSVYALLRRFRPAPEVFVTTPQQRALPKDVETDLMTPRQARERGRGYLVVPTAFVEWLLPVSGLVATFFFLRGHDAPGGGFVAGLVMTVGLLLQYIVSGTAWVEDRIRLTPRVLIGAGLLLVVVTAAGPLVFAYPVLTSYALHLTIPLLGEVVLGTAMLFDLGISCLVLGTTLLILIALAHQSIRARRVTGGK